MVAAAGGSQGAVGWGGQGVEVDNGDPAARSDRIAVEAAAEAARSRHPAQAAAGILGIVAAEALQWEHQAQGQAEGASTGHATGDPCSAVGGPQAAAAEGATGGLYAGEAAGAHIRHNVLAGEAAAHTDYHTHNDARADRRAGGEDVPEPRARAGQTARRA